MEAIASREEAMASRLEAIASPDFQPLRVHSALSPTSRIASPSAVEALGASLAPRLDRILQSNTENQGNFFHDLSQSKENCLS